MTALDKIRVTVEIFLIIFLVVIGVKLYLDNNATESTKLPYIEPVSEVVNLRQVFLNCTNPLSGENLPYDIIFDNLTNYTEVFSQCTNPLSADIFANVTNYTEIFSQCTYTNEGEIYDE